MVRRFSKRPSSDLTSYPLIVYNQDALFYWL